MTAPSFVPSFVYGLGIAGLPPLVDNMNAGGLYSVQTASPLARTALILSVVSTAVRHATPVVLVCGGSPQRLLERARASGMPHLEQAARDGQLLLFGLKESSAKNIFRHGARRFLLELEHFKVPQGVLVVFDSADELFTLQDPFVASEQIREYRDWFQQHAACGLFLFNLLAPNTQFASTYQTILEYLNGAARLESQHEKLEWLVEFWLSPTGVVASRALQATIGSDGALTASATVSSPDLALQAPAADENHVFTLDSTLVGIAKQAAGPWVFAENLVGLLHACRSAVAATIILVYDRNTDLRQLAQAAHTLRITLGKRMRIVVRELDASLRFQNEFLLLNLGVNLVVHRDVSVSRILLLLESLKGQVFNRNIDVDFESALASVTPGKLQGYLPPPIFSHEVEAVLERSKALAVPFALVEMELPKNMSAADAVARFKVTRAGDLLTAVEGKIYVFLSACPQVSLLMALKRLGGDTIEDDFPRMRFCLSAIEVTTELAAIGRSTEAPGVPGITLVHAA